MVEVEGISFDTEFSSKDQEARTGEKSHRDNSPVSNSRLLNIRKRTWNKFSLVTLEQGQVKEHEARLRPERIIKRFQEMGTVQYYRRPSMERNSWGRGPSVLTFFYPSLEPWQSPKIYPCRYLQIVQNMARQEHMEFYHAVAFNNCSGTSLPWCTTCLLCIYCF